MVILNTKLLHTLAQWQYGLSVVSVTNLCLPTHVKANHQADYRISNRYLTGSGKPFYLPRTVPVDTEQRKRAWLSDSNSSTAG